MSFPWKDFQSDLERLAGRGLSASTIAEELFDLSGVHVTKNAVIGRLARTGQNAMEEREMSNVVPLRPQADVDAALPFHELANVLPLLEDERFDELVKSIKEIGQLDPITTFEGAILDGRNRYRACVKLGVPPLFEPLKADVSPVKFVVGKNMSRRDLTKSQRSYAMAQFATYKSGGDTTKDVSIRNKVPDAQPSAQPEYTLEQAAEIAGSNVKYIQYGKLVMKEGTADEKEGVRNGTLNLRAVAKKIEARRAKSTDETTSVEDPELGASSAEQSPCDPEEDVVATCASVGMGYRVAVPPGLTMSDWGRKGIELEAQGWKLEEVIKEIGCEARTYSRIRDLCLLFDRSDLNKSDRKLVEEAYHQMNRERRISDPHAAVRPLIERIWGARGQRGRADKQRVEAFNTALIVIESTCQRASELEIPYLSEEVARETVTQLNKAIKNLGLLKAKLVRKEV